MIVSDVIPEQFLLDKEDLNGWEPAYVDNTEVVTARIEHGRFTPVEAAGFLALGSPHFFEESLNVYAEGMAYESRVSRWRERAMKDATGLGNHATSYFCALALWSERTSVVDMNTGYRSFLQAVNPRAFEKARFSGSKYIEKPDDLAHLPDKMSMEIEDIMVLASSGYRMREDVIFDAYVAENPGVFELASTEYKKWRLGLGFTEDEAEREIDYVFRRDTRGNLRSFGTEDIKAIDPLEYLADSIRHAQ